MNNIVIFGANGGLGFAFLKYFALKGDFCIACCSTPKHIEDNLELYEIDTSKIKIIAWRADEEQDYEQVGDYIKTHKLTLDFCFNTVGVLQAEVYSPEKKLDHISKDALLWSFQINTLTAALILKYITPFMTKDNGCVMAHLSARVGSISDNKLGGWYAYRASKAALNMIIKTASIEQKLRNKQLCIVALHPGTVETALSKPFRSQVKKERLFSADQSVGYLIDNVIIHLNPEKSGCFYAWDGTEIDW